MCSTPTLLDVMFVVAIVSVLSLETRGNVTTNTFSPSLTTEMVTDLAENDVMVSHDYIHEMTKFPVEDGTTSVLTTSSPEEGTVEVVKAKFTVRDKSTNDMKEPLKTEIATAIDNIFTGKFIEYNTSAVTAFSPGSGNAAVVAMVDLHFSPRITDDEWREVVKVLYEAVERNHTLSDCLSVEELYVKNHGTYMRIENACSITPCAEDMTCFLDGNECRSKCDNNERYCTNGGSCVEASSESTMISCSCAEEFIGARCDKRADGDDGNGKPDLYVGIIAASAIAGIIVVSILLATCINFINKRRIRTGRPGELFGIENVVALELSDEKSHISGTATQTDESFLLARSHKDGVAPKPGHAHKIMQTNDSFLLAKAQLLRAHGGAAAARHRSSGSPVGVVSGNARRLSGPSSSKSSEGESTPITSTSGGNNVVRKPSTKTERAPDPPSGHEAAPQSATRDQKSAEEPTSRSERQMKENGAKNRDPQIVQAVITDAVPKGGNASLELKDEKSDAHQLYQGRKILKV